MIKSLKNKSILITGGTGSFGTKCAEIIFSKYNPKKVIIFSRDELKQYELSKKFPENKYPIRFFIGDVRDRQRLYRACANVDFIIHAAAMKRVTASEYNPYECISTNIIGAQNVIDAALENNVKKVIALSTDKAANPVNIMGASKLLMEKIILSKKDKFRVSTEDISTAITKVKWPARLQKIETHYLEKLNQMLP